MNFRRGASALFVCMVAFAGAFPAQAQDDNRFISEIRIGALAHDTGPFTDRKERSPALNAEILFGSVGMLGKGVLRPHIGGSMTTGGKTDQVYAGLSSTWPVMNWGFFELSLGGMAHSGNTNEGEPGRKDLGCHVLFRGSVSGGIYLGPHHSLSVMLDHASNANLCKKNEGLESVGVRYGFRF